MTQDDPINELLALERAKGRAEVNYQIEGQRAQTEVYKARAVDLQQQLDRQMKATLLWFVVALLAIGGFGGYILAGDK